MHSSIQDRMLSPSSLAVSSVVQKLADHVVTAAKMSLAALMHCSLLSSGQASSMDQISSFTPSFLQLLPDLRILDLASTFAHGFANGIPARRIACSLLRVRCCCLPAQADFP